ncbi:hypothetical protein [Sorangium sp. So ce1151]|uniref:hypothetical protein n=1 Tax=Sorangium sp. So ce1151 TaxID=3133332 RepID=UPI003F5DEE3B
MEIDLIRFDREVARAARAWRAALDDVTRRGPAPAGADQDGATAAEARARLENPLDPFRRVSARTTYLELTGTTPSLGAELGLASQAEASAPDPTGLAAPLADWVYTLTLERVVWADRLRLAAAWHAASLFIDVPEPARMSPHEARLRLLADPTDAGRQTFAEVLARGAGGVADAARILVERRHEAARRLDEARRLAVEIPCDPPDAALGAAEALLQRTEPMLQPAATWHGALGRAVGRDAASGWPARLGPRWLEELFRPTGLTEGLAIDLGPLPRPLGAASFARALARFGAALARADGARGPFALGHAPCDLQRARRAALFGGLVADPVFCARALGLGRGRALDQARATAQSLVLSLRLDAATVGLTLRGGPDGGGHVLLLAARDRKDRFEEATARALGAPIPGTLAGVVPALEPDAAVRLAGALLAARDRRDLIERFDEDWFRNPRAAEALRDEDSAPRAPASETSGRASAAALEAGLDEMMRSLASL